MREGIRLLQCFGSAPYRRDELLCVLPEVKSQIIEGDLNLSVASQVQVFFTNEARAKNEYTPEEKRELVNSMTGKSTRQVERELVTISPKSAMPESTRWITEDRIELKLGLDAKTLDQLEKIKALLSHKFPKMSFEDLVVYMSELTLEKIDPVRKEERVQKKKSTSKKKSPSHQAAPAPTPELTPEPTPERATEPALPAPEAIRVKNSRHIPAATRRKVWIRDEGQCTYTDPRTGQQCRSKHFAQPDHIQPYALGGTHEEENLRVLCAAHNQRRARQTWPEQNWRKQNHHHFEKTCE